MKYYPSHIDKENIEATDRFLEKSNTSHHYYKLICSCKGSLFYLFESDKHTIKALCHHCLNSILVYDLSKYPCALKLSGIETFAPIKETEKVPAAVYVGYEYGEIDEDQEPNENDITWCSVFIETEGILVKVFDDETA